MSSNLRERGITYKDRDTETLNKIGLREFSAGELRNAHEKLTTAIRIGVTRQGAPTTEDGGVAAIPSPVEPITHDQLGKIPVGSRVFGGSYGGTSWYSAISEKGQNVNVSTKIINNGSIPKNERSHTLSDFVCLIGDHVVKGIGDRDVSDVRAIGISAGFAHINTPTKRGIEAQIHEQPSNWHIRDLDSTRKPQEQPYLGEALLTYFHYQGLPQVNGVYFQNDTNAVVHDIPGKNISSVDTVMPVGFVFGTGSNAALGRFNTQLSNQEGIIPSDQIADRMMARGDIKNPRQLKVLVGGDRIAHRVIAATDLLAEKGNIGKKSAGGMAELIKSGNGTILSKIASGELSYADLTKEYDVSFSLEEYDILRKSSKMALNQAGQVIGVMIGSVVKAGGYKQGEVELPVEGSVFWKGHNVQTKARETLQVIIPGNGLFFQEASGTQGVSKLAMVHHQEMH